jgi:hypothetical protein
VSRVCVARILFSLLALSVSPAPPVGATPLGNVLLADLLGGRRLSEIVAEKTALFLAYNSKPAKVSCSWQP